MKSLLILSIFLGTFFTIPDYISPCGAKVPERDENHQVINPEFLFDIVDDNPKPNEPKSEEKIEWIPDPNIPDYEYHDRPNGIRVCRPKPKIMQHTYPDLPKVLNPEFL